jgi:hypothetical protein
MRAERTLPSFTGIVVLAHGNRRCGQAPQLLGRTILVATVPGTRSGRRTALESCFGKALPALDRTNWSGFGPHDVYDDVGSVKKHFSMHLPGIDGQWNLGGSIERFGHEPWSQEKRSFR